MTLTANRPKSPFDRALLTEIRDRFLYVDHDPFAGPRAFFETSGGSLKLKAATEAVALWSGAPDNEGRANPASQAYSAVCEQGKADLTLLFGTEDGVIISGETGSECINKVTRAAAMALPPGPILSCPLEHPATWDAAQLWAERTGRERIIVPYDPETGKVTPEQYAAAVTPETRIAMVIHTSNVTGMRVDLPGIVRAIRAVAPDCYIITDGIQHAAHGALSVADWGVDAYVFSPYKIYARHGKGFAWLSNRLAALPHDKMLGAPPTSWELGARDPGVYAAMSAVIDYLCWIGGRFADRDDRRARLEAAAAAMAAHERYLLDLVLFGDGDVPGLTDMPEVALIGPNVVDDREGMLSFTLADWHSRQVEKALNERGLRVFSMTQDPYAGHILKHMDVEHVVRVSLCHYNSREEVLSLLRALDALRRQPVAA